jgi:uncharacterized membrane protein YecN with MAPEG domain
LSGAAGNKFMNTGIHWITPLYAGLLGLLLIVLSVKVTRHRRTLLVGIGDGGEKALARAIRAHGNLTEYAPIALILLAAVEIQGAPPFLVHGLGIALVLGRVLHAIGISRSSGKSYCRAFGMILTWLMIALASVIVIVNAIGQTRLQG